MMGIPRWLKLAPSPVLAIAIFVFSSMSQPPAPDYGFEWGDKINHAGAFGLLCLFTLIAFNALKPGRPLKGQLVICIVLVALYGASDEFHQYFVPGRECDVFDWLADAAGALLAGLCYGIFRRNVRYKSVQHMARRSAIKVEDNADHTGQSS